MHPGMVCIELNHDNLRILKMTALDSISPSGALYLCRNVDYYASRHLCTKSKSPINQEAILPKGGDIAVEAQESSGSVSRQECYDDDRLANVIAKLGKLSDFSNFA